MEKLLEDRIYNTINNYRNAKINLRNDGDLINHFASLIFAHYEKEIPFDKVKEIRKYIKASSSRVSSFRGDILYILSLLIALEDGDAKELITDIYEVEEILKEQGFNECDYLVLTSFVLAKYGRKKDKHSVAEKMKSVLSY